MLLNRGYVQVYTGNGKGKTTAAFGLAMRAVGRGLNVKIYQFLKGTPSGELEAAKRLAPELEIRRIAETQKFFKELSNEERRQLQLKTEQEFRQLVLEVAGGYSDVIILDEILVALDKGVLTAEQVCRLIDEKPVHVELVLTGRHAPQSVIEKADLVTEMRAIKHYYAKGVPAREGIER